MIVCNATPLIAFARIGQLAILQSTVRDIFIPDAVAKEIAQYRGRPPGVIDVAAEQWIQVESVQGQQQIHLLLPTLDRGEAEVIALALEREAELVLMDELSGRKVAESLGLSVCGSIGILLQAKRDGRIAAVKPFIDDMRRQGIRYGERFIQAVLQSVDELELNS